MDSVPQVPSSLHSLAVAKTSSKSISDLTVQEMKDELDFLKITRPSTGKDKLVELLTLARANAGKPNEQNAITPTKDLATSTDNPSKPNGSSGRGPKWTKNDMVRLLHVVTDPACSAGLTQLSVAKSRQELDSRVASPWDTIFPQLFEDAAY